MMMACAIDVEQHRYSYGPLFGWESLKQLLFDCARIEPQFFVAGHRAVAVAINRSVSRIINMPRAAVEDFDDRVRAGRILAVTQMDLAHLILAVPEQGRHRRAQMPAILRAGF